jgi:hypothetical protein
MGIDWNDRHARVPAAAAASSKLIDRIARIASTVPGPACVIEVMATDQK